MPVIPTKERFDLFNGGYLPQNKDVVYVSTKANKGFINITGHELYRDLKRKHPELHNSVLDLVTFLTAQGANRYFRLSRRQACQTIVAATSDPIPRIFFRVHSYTSSGNLAPGLMLL